MLSFFIIIVIALGCAGVFSLFLMWSLVFGALLFAALIGVLWLLFFLAKIAFIIGLIIILPLLVLGVICSIAGHIVFH